VSLQRLLASGWRNARKLEVQWTRHKRAERHGLRVSANPQARLVGCTNRIAGFLRSMSPPFPIPEGLLRLAAVTPLDLFVSLTFDSLSHRRSTRSGPAAERRRGKSSSPQPVHRAQNEALKVRRATRRSSSICSAARRASPTNASRRGRARVHPSSRQRRRGAARVLLSEFRNRQPSDPRRAPRRLAGAIPTSRGDA